MNLQKIKAMPSTLNNFERIYKQMQLSHLFDRMDMQIFYNYATSEVDVKDLAVAFTTSSDYIEETLEEVYNYYIAYDSIKLGICKDILDRIRKVG